jgi:hypothetical protein
MKLKLRSREASEFYFEKKPIRAWSGGAGDLSLIGGVIGVVWMG